MHYTAQVLVISQQDGAVFAAADRLQDRGLPTICAETDDAALVAAKDMSVDAVLIDGMGRTKSELEELAIALRAQIPAKPIPIILVSDEVTQTEGGHFNSVLYPPVHGLQLAVRVQSALRLSIMEEEVESRGRTVFEIGQDLSKKGLKALDHRPVSVLFTGGATPQFIALKNALEQSGAEVTAALTSFTAFDYLHDKSFDVIVLNVLKELEPSFTIASAMRRNTRLFHVPAVMLIDPENFESIDEAFARGASDLVNPANGPDIARRRILNLATECRRREQVKQAFEAIRSPAIIDAETGLFTKQFFAKHLTNASKAAKQSDRPLSLTVIRAMPPPDISETHIEAARRQFGGMLRHLVRAEDMAARIDPGVFSILMPGASKQPAQSAAKRIEGVVDCTAFESGNSEKPFQLELEVEVLELQPRETPDHLLQRAMKS